MLFNSVAFIFVFLPATLLIFFLVAKASRVAALCCLTVASLIFYAQTDSRYLLILVPSIIANYLVGSALSGERLGDNGRFAIVTFGIAANLACLFTFKYLDLFIDTIDRLNLADIGLLHIELPLGISFFTFTQIAFLVDAYQRKVSEPRFVNYALFVSYFPHLVAGPILHHAEMMPQFSAEGTFRPRLENFAVGLSVFFIGLFKKASWLTTSRRMFTGYSMRPGRGPVCRHWKGGRARCSMRSRSISTSPAIQTWQSGYRFCSG